MSKKRKPGSPEPSGPSPTSVNPSQAVPTVAPTPELKHNPSSRPSISQYVSFGLLIGVIAVLGFVFFEVMAKFLVPLFLAAILVVVFRPLHGWILIKSNGRERFSALATTASVLIVVLAPMAIVLVMAAAEGQQIVRQFNSAKFVDGFHQARANLKLDMPSADEIRTIESDFHELRKTSSLSPDLEYEHRELLFSIEEAAESIAKRQGLYWPPDPSDPTDPTNEKTSSPNANSTWDSFVDNAAQARIMAHDLVWDAPENLDQWHNYLALLNQTSEEFSQFKNQILGGKTSAWLKELANPSADETETYIEKVVEFARTKLLKLGGAGASFFVSILVGTAIMIIGLYFFLLDGPKMIETFKGLSPIDDGHEQELVDEFSRVSRAVVVATLLSALVQGLLAGIGFYFTGLESIFLLTVMSAVLAMVPFVGAASVWVPCSLYLYFVQGEIVSAIGLAVYGAAVISMADNVIKPMILHGQSNLHPLLALLSVLGGVTTLGPIGILVGPMVVAFLQTLLKILQRELTDFEQMSGSSQSPTP